MNINPSPESQAKVKLDKLFSDSSINSNPSISAQARNSYELYQMIAGLIMVYEVLGLTRGACSALMVQAGFNSADETANAGHLLGAGGLVLGAAGVVQGIGKFQEAKGIAEAIEIRNDELKSLDEEFAAKDLNQDVTVEVEAIGEPCTSTINEDLILEVEEDALCNAKETLSTKENKMQDKAEDVKQSIVKEDRVFGDVEQNKRIKLVNKKYDVLVDYKKSNAGKLQAIGTPGQAAYYAAQGLSELQKPKSQKEGLIQQVQQDNQQQQANTADGIKREIDKLADFDPFQRNCSSQR